MGTSSTLVLSRAREDGLTDDQSSLFLHPESNGELRVAGRVGATPVSFGPVAATLDGRLRESIEALAAHPIE